LLTFVGVLRTFFLLEDKGREADAGGFDMVQNGKIRSSLEIKHHSGIPLQRSTIVEHLFCTPLQDFYGFNFNYSCIYTEHKVFVSFTVRRGFSKTRIKTFWKICENQFCLP
jgi:hypothetical protein